MAYSTIDASELPRLLSEGHPVIDVRSPGEFKSVHVEGAVSTPLDRFDPAELVAQHGKRAVYILCQSGKRAEMAATQLAQAGLEEPVVVTGGTAAAIEAGVSVVRGNGSISIERQVRIAAGSLICIGSLLGFVVHSGFFAIPSFIGAGLVFAGVTDTCGMGIMLSKCPWNR